LSDHDLARLKDTDGLLGDEALLEGWAARDERCGNGCLGLVLVTNYRLIFAEVGGALTAFPISKIHAAEIHSPACVSFSTWYGRLILTFDNPETTSAVLNLLRQDSDWNAVEMNLSRRRDWPAVEPQADGPAPATLAGRVPQGDDTLVDLLKAG
jgi:hypothetical protein